jgi:hypothetical protein
MRRRGQTESPRSARRRARVLFVLPLVALALSGCFSSGFAYVSHRNPDKTDLYFKVPTSWRLFNADQELEASNGRLSKSQLNQIEQGTWVTAFSGNPKAKPSSSIYGNRFPGGIVLARQLGVNDRDQFSYASMRAMLLGSDPLSGGSQYNVLSYSEFTKPGGIRGSKFVVDITGANHVVTTFAQETAVDPATNWAYVIGLGCRASCWGPNASLINQVLNSWNLKSQS